MAIDRYYARHTYTDEEYERIFELSRSGAVMAYLYCNKVIKDGERRNICSSDKKIRAIGRDSVALLPMSFFAEQLGCEAFDGTVSHGERSVRLIPEEKGNFSVAPKLREGIIYTPAVETAIALGFAAKAYCDGQLIVIGTEEHIRAMDEGGESLAEAGGFAVFGEYDPSEATAEDYSEAKRIFRERLVGNPELNDMSDPLIKAKVDRISENCGRRWANMNKTGDPVILWGDKAPVESDQLSTQYGRIRELAFGYATYGSEYYHNEELLRDIIFGLEWLYAHMYGEAEMRNEGWRDVFAFNWWHWLSGATDPMTDAILAIEEHLTDEQIRRFTGTYDGMRNFLHNAPSVKVMTKVGLLNEDREKFIDCNALCENAMILDDSGQGRHTDYLNFSHRFPHNISYGSLVLENTLYTMSCLSSTALAYIGPKKYNLFKFLKYGFEPSMFNGRGYMMYFGRTTRGSESLKGAEIIARLISLIGVFGDDEDEYIKRFIKRSVKNYPTVLKNMANHLTFLDVKMLNDILNDPSIPDKTPYEYAHVWYTGDRVSQQRNNYGIALALSSRRSFTYESINNQNKTGWYIGDGSTYIYTDYDGESFDGENFIHKNIEVAYHFPGTTEDQQPRVIRSISNTHAWRNPTDFSGGVQFKNKFFTAGMEFIAMHYEGADDKVDVGYGGGLAPHNNDLVAKKAYFGFDNEIVCLGAGITSTMSSPVNTTLEHKRLLREDESFMYVDGVKLPKECFEREYEDMRYFLMEGHAGFVILDGKKALVRRYICEEAGNQPFAECRIQHGKNPIDGTYAYAIVPYATLEGIEEYSKAPEVEIISNTAELQAVRERTTGAVGMVFHKAGECLGIKVSEPCILMTDKDELRVSEPSGKLESLIITLEGERKISALDSKVTAESLDGNTVLTVDITGANGKPFGIKF